MSNQDNGSPSDEGLSEKFRKLGWKGWLFGAFLLMYLLFGILDWISFTFHLKPGQAWRWLFG